MANNGGCEHECVNTIGTYYCRCWPGFELSGDGNTCSDIDECAVSNGGCSDRCVNSPGGFRCDCPSDLYLHADGRTCGSGFHFENLILIKSYFLSYIIKPRKKLEEKC